MRYHLGIKIAWPWLYFAFMIIPLEPCLMERSMGPGRIYNILRPSGHIPLALLKGNGALSDTAATAIKSWSEEDDRKARIKREIYNALVISNS